MVHRPPLTERQFYAIAPNLYATSPKARKPYQLVKFTVNAQMIKSLEAGTARASELIRYLSLLAKSLAEARLLYA
jgi:hypothetical protein